MGTWIEFVAYFAGLIHGMAILGASIGRGPFWDGFRDGLSPMFWWQKLRPRP